LLFSSNIMLDRDGLLPINTTVASLSFAAKGSKKPDLIFIIWRCSSAIAGSRWCLERRSSWVEGRGDECAHTPSTELF
jgi:hypothetical protein